MKALQLLRRADVRLVLTITNGGLEYSIADGGRVTVSTAKKILGRRDIVPGDSGLFIDHPQTWKRLPRRPRP